MVILVLAAEVRGPSLLPLIRVTVDRLANPRPPSTHSFIQPSCKKPLSLYKTYVI
jgi:hypothetical protein